MPKPIAVFAQKFYRGENPLLVDLAGLPEVKSIRAHWDVNRWGRGTETPMFEFCVTIREVPQEILAEAAGRVSTQVIGEREQRFDHQPRRRPAQPDLAIASNRNSNIFAIVEAHVCQELNAPLLFSKPPRSEGPAAALTLRLSALSGAREMSAAERGASGKCAPVSRTEAFRTRRDHDRELQDGYEIGQVHRPVAGREILGAQFPTSTCATTRAVPSSTASLK